MKRNLVFLIVCSFISLLFSNFGNDKKNTHNPINLHFSPTEDYLMNQDFFPNFINYPDDRVKLGLRGNVKDVRYNTLHSLAYLFSEEGKLLSKEFIASGGRQKETSIYNHILQ